MPRGIASLGDVVEQLADGTPINNVWDELQAVMVLLNERRSAFSQLLSFPMTGPSALIPQTLARDEFEEASEYGVPKSIRNGADTIRLGFGFKDYDAATSYTWKFLRDADPAQVIGIHNQVLEADNRLTFKTILRQLMWNIPTVNDEGYTCYPLWNGDGMVPPPYLTNNYTGSESHYLVSGAATLDSTDVEALVAKVQLKGYAPSGQDGAKLLIIANSAQTRLIRSWRANVVNANGAIAEWDFIPSETANPYLTTENLVGERPAGEFNRLPVIGSYGPALIVEEDLVPAGYVVCIATGGPDSPNNIIGFREHANAAYRGLRLLPGISSGYPMTGAFYTRSFGTGVRHRGAGAVMQIKASGSYASPTSI